MTDVIICVFCVTFDRAMSTGTHARQPLSASVDYTHHDFGFASILYSGLCMREYN